MTATPAPILLTLLVLPFAATAAEQVLPQSEAYETPEAWRRPVEPFRVADSTWYVGTEGLSVILVKTADGAVLIDGGLLQAAPVLLEYLQQLDVPPGQLKYILHSHAHGDHVGPLAALRRATGARVVSNAESAALLARGGSDDLFFGDGILYPPVVTDRLVQDGEALELGGVRFVAHFTPGHTPGSLTWTWNDTRDGAETQIVYADSLTAPGYQLIDNPRYPHIVDDYRRSFARLRDLRCDLLITPHPDFSGWKPAEAQTPHAEPTTCRAYAAAAEARLDEQLEKERADTRAAAGSARSQ